MRTHHDKHHKAYVDVANTLVAEKGLADKTMEELVAYAKATSGEQKLFNQSGQAWNHAFFWECMTPGLQGARRRSGQGHRQRLRLPGRAEDQVCRRGRRPLRLGLGVAGLRWRGPEGDLHPRRRHRPGARRDPDPGLATSGSTPIILDYKNLRKDFLEKWFDGVANWAFAAKQLAGETYKYPAPVDEAKAA